jgi:hypothetical protein
MIPTIKPSTATCAAWVRWPSWKPQKAVIDGPTKDGPWAYMCSRHKVHCANLKLATKVNQRKEIS